MKGYTLIEVIIAVVLLAIILLGGTSLFYQNLKLSGLSDVDSNLSNSLRTILSSIEKDIRYAQITAVGEGTRLDCVAAGEAGYVGDSLTVSDLDGYGTVYSVEDDKIASTSSQTDRVSYLTSDDLSISKLEFTWYCATNISDKIKIVIDGSSNALSSGIEVERSVSAEINLLNSGLN